MSFFLAKMKDGSAGECPGNCNGHGSCIRGFCVCELKYSGGTCSDTNHGYFVGFSVVFFFVCAVSIAQLILCVHSEFCQLKRPSLAKACRLTVQKMLYVCMIVACGTRGVYYSIQRYLTESLGLNLFNAYYPFIISGFSIIICYWAETFHVVGLKLDKPRFLSKSSLGFTIFNVLVYVVFLAHFITAEVTNETTKAHLYYVFTGFLVVLMFLMLIFFLIYGVELFYKVRGAFIARDNVQASDVDHTQATMSRFGLVSQASFQLATSMFLLGDIMREKWKNRLPIEGLNCLDVVFRVLELGVALWFMCCLWNWKSPGQLWILNPKRLLISVDHQEQKHLLGGSEPARYEAIKKDLDAPRQECWICYENERPDAGPLIFPCQCKGDVAAVHHNCLRRWLIESFVGSQNESCKCKICEQEYTLAAGRMWLPSGLTVRHWIQTTLILSMMIGAPIGAYLVCLTSIPPACKILVIGLSLVLECVCLRLLGFNMLLVYRRARLATMTIISRTASYEQQPIEEEPVHETDEGSTATA